MNTNQSSRPQQPSKAYQAPQLHRYGSVRTLTETTFNAPGGVDNASGFTMFKTL